MLGVGWQASRRGPADELRPRVVAGLLALAACGCEERVRELYILDGGMEVRGQRCWLSGGGRFFFPAVPERTEKTGCQFIGRQKWLTYRKYHHP
jgi:hypothetical protein